MEENGRRRSCWLAGAGKLGPYVPLGPACNGGARSGRRSRRAAGRCCADQGRPSTSPLHRHDGRAKSSGRQSWGGSRLLHRRYMRHGAAGLFRVALRIDAIGVQAGVPVLTERCLAFGRASSSRPPTSYRLTPWPFGVVRDERTVGLCAFHRANAPACRQEIDS